jgi:hypothetical protein
VQLTADGRIVIGGTRFAKNDRFAAALRFKTNGAPDGRFARAGIATADFHRLAGAPINNGVGTSMAIRDDGAILLAGPVGDQDVGFARFTASGKADPAFGERGLRLLPASFANAVGLALLPDGKFLASTDGADITVSRHLPDNVPEFASLSRGRLRVLGTNGPDTIALTRQVIDAVDMLVARQGGFEQRFTLADVARLSIEAGDGDDTISLAGLAIPGEIDGGRGDDTVIGSDAADRIQGGDGNDRLTGGPGADRLAGGRGNDTLLARDGEPDRVIGGRGDDVAEIDDPLDRHDRLELL